MSSKLYQVYCKLYADLGPQKWWPARSRFEIIVGAILTQNTAWTNVAKAIRNLRKQRCLTLKDMNRMTLSGVESCVRPSGCFRIKARRLKAMIRFIQDEYEGSLSRMFADEAALLRKKLLRIKGIGPETADSILLYAGQYPSFVIDAYTRRIFSRHGWIRSDAAYGDIQHWVKRSIPVNTKIYNEFHALLVAIAKKYCLKSLAHCERCPLQEFLSGNRYDPSFHKK